MSKIILVVCNGVNEFHTYTSQCNLDASRRSHQGLKVDDVMYRYVDSTQRILEMPDADVQFVGNFEQRSDLGKIIATREALTAYKIHEMCQNKKET